MVTTTAPYFCMPEVHSFESSSATQTTPTFERNFVSPGMVESVRAKAQTTRSLYECHVSEEQKEAEDCLAQMELALANATNGIPIETKKELPVTLNVPEKLSASRPPESSLDRKRIATYGNLSDLAYVDFVRTSESLKTGKLEVWWVVLDPLSFPNIRNIEKTGVELTENEEVLQKFLREHSAESFRQDLVTFDAIPVSRDTSELLYIASSGKFDQSGIGTKMAMRRLIPEQNADTTNGINRWTVTDRVAPDYSPKYASIEPKYRSTLIDVEPSEYVFPEKSKEPNTSLLEEEKLQILRLNAGLEHVRQFKTKESSTLFESLQWQGYAIVDHFPDTEAKDSGSSWFSAIAVKDKAGKTLIAVRWTELTDFWDIGADFKLAIWRVPENQTRDLVAFMERNLQKLPSWEKIRIIGHSLGWALTQLASVMYDDRVEESYTFNSPGAKKLKVNPKSQPEEVRDKFEKYANFVYNTDNTSVENRIVNVVGSKWPSLISNLGNDVGFYKIELKGLQSHSITTLVEEVNKETTELMVVDVRKKRNNEKDNTILP